MAVCAVGCAAILGCGDSSSSASESVEGSGVCGTYTTYADGLGNTYCYDAAGELVYSVLENGSILYPEPGNQTGDSLGIVVDPVTGDTVLTGSRAVCGETSEPVSVVGDFYFYSDAFGSYYYDVTLANCVKNYLSAASSSSGEGVSSSETEIVVESSSGENSLGSSSSRGVSSSSESVLNGANPKITFASTGVSVEEDNGCILVEGSTVTVSCGGSYYFTGSSEDGQIIIAAPTTDKVYLYLNGISLASGDAPIYAQSSDKTFLVAVKGTTNTLSDGSSRSRVYTYIKNGETKTDTTKACIYAKDDLTIKGGGTLNVFGNWNNGIQTSNDLKFRLDDELGGAPTVEVTAKNNAIKGKGSVSIDGGTFTLTTETGDAIQSYEDDAVKLASGKGHVEITGGTFTIQAADDGIQAANYILFDDSVGTPNVKVNASGKAIKADSSVFVYDGILNVTSTLDDGIHSNGHVYMVGGSVTISSGDDGIHADSNLYLRGSTINVTKAVEGFEGVYIYAEAGITAVFATDDAWNAAGGASKNSSSNGGFGGGFGGGMQSSSWGEIQISGGYHYLSVSGNDVDVLDANGSAYQTGGVVILELLSSGGGMGGGNFGGFGGGFGGNSGSCSTNQSGGLIDTDNGFSISGGVLLGFGSQTEEYPSCTATSYTNANYYGSSNAAFKPQGSGSMIIYGGSVPSVSTVETSAMTAVLFPNGLTYYYK